jgi:dihydrofolate reductase
MKKSLIQIALIVAMGNNRVIGYKNQLPWHLPADLRHFKELTMGKPIIMGRKTFESIGKPLPGRRNIIITSDLNWTAAGCEVVNSVAAAIKAAENSEEIMIIGGEKVFVESLPLATRIYLTIIHHDFIGDKFFPEWNNTEWSVIERTDFKPDSQNLYPYSFLTLERK